MMRENGVMTHAPSNDSDRPAQMRRPIRVIPRRSMANQDLKIFLRCQVEFEQIWIFVDLPLLFCIFSSESSECVFYCIATHTMIIHATVLSHMYIIYW